MIHSIWDVCVLYQGWNPLGEFTSDGRAIKRQECTVKDLKLLGLKSRHWEALIWISFIPPQKTEEVTKEDKRNVHADDVVGPLNSSICLWLYVHIQSYTYICTSYCIYKYLTTMWGESHWIWEDVGDVVWFAGTSSFIFLSQHDQPRQRPSLNPSAVSLRTHEPLGASGHIPAVQVQPADIRTRTVFTCMDHFTIGEKGW